MQGRLLATLILSFAAITGRAETADERLAAFFREHLEASFRMRPLDATMLGDHRFDHLLDAWHQR